MNLPLSITFKYICFQHEPSLAHLLLGMSTPSMYFYSHIALRYVCSQYEPSLAHMHLDMSVPSMNPFLRITFMYIWTQHEPSLCFLVWNFHRLFCA